MTFGCSAEERGYCIIITITLKGKLFGKEQTLKNIYRSSETCCESYNYVIIGASG